MDVECFQASLDVLVCDVCTELHFMSLYAKFAENLVKSGSMKHEWNKQLLMATCLRINIVYREVFPPEIRF